MPRRIEFHGTVHEFPDEFTDQQISMALQSYVGQDQPAPTPEATEPRTLGGLISNIPGSAYRMVEPILPQNIPNTIASMGKVARGLMGYAVPGLSGYRVDADAVGRGLKERYGGWENLINTAYTDPVGMFADMSMVLSGGSTIAMKSTQLAGKVAKASAAVSKMPAWARIPIETSAKAGILLTKDPVQITSDALGAITKRATTVARYYEGLLTGRGVRTQAYFATQTPSALRRGMRAADAEGEILNGWTEALKNLKKERGEQYRQKLAEVQQSDQILDISDVRDALRQKLVTRGVKMPPPGNKLYKKDFAKSPIAQAVDQETLIKLYNDLNNWGKEAGDLTPLGVDRLKQRVFEYYGEGKTGRDIVESVRADIRQKLSAVPGYDEMVAQYEEASKLIENIEKDLNLKRGTNPGTTLRKLFNAFNENTSHRSSLLEALQKYAPGDLLGMTAGWQMSSWFPTGILRPLAAGGAVSGMWMDNPAMLGMAAATSPRLAGETMLGIRGAADIARKVKQKADLTGITVPLKPEFYRSGAYATEATKEKKP